MALPLQVAMDYQVAIRASTIGLCSLGRIFTQASNSRETHHIEIEVSNKDKVNRPIWMKVLIQTITGGVNSN